MNTYEEPSFSKTVQKLNIGELEEMIAWQAAKNDVSDEVRMATTQSIKVESDTIRASLQLLTKENLLRVLNAMQERGIRSPLISESRRALEQACNGSIEQSEADARKAIVYLSLQLRLIGFQKLFEAALEKA